MGAVDNYHHIYLFIVVVVVGVVDCVEKYETALKYRDFDCV